MDILELWQGKIMTAWASSTPVAAKSESAIESEFAAETNDTYGENFDTGLWKTRWDAGGGETHGGHDRWKRLSNGLTRPSEPNVVQVSIGALGDSAYEYLLKQYLLSGGTEVRLLNMCK